MSQEPVHGIGAVVARTGVPEATLRVWERRYGFPSPARLASGHRRYSEREIELIREVAAKRAAGWSLAAAIEQARGRASEPAVSIYASLRRRRPELQPQTLVKPMMLALSQAIEDEVLARAQRSLVFGSFQHERFYRQAQVRWRELARTAELALVFADFEHLQTPRGAPIEVPVPRDHPLNREWALVCEGDDFALCLTGWEAPEHADRPDARRSFEAIWSVDPDVVREGSRICVALGGGSRLPLPDSARRRLATPASLTLESQIQLATAVSTRMLSRLSTRLIRSGL